MAKRTMHTTARHRIWFGVLFVLIGLVSLRLVAPVWAAPPASPHHQTVPLPTATSPPASFPTATPATAASNPDDDDDDDDDDSDTDSSDTADDAEGDDVEYGVSFEEPTPTPAESATADSTTANENAENGAANVVTDADSGVATQDAPARETAGIDGAVGTNYTATATQLILNLRAEPQPDAEVRGAVFQDDVLRIVGHNGDRSWWFVCCVFGREVPGWADANFIALDDPDLVLADESIPQLLETANRASNRTSIGTADTEPSSLRLTMQHDPAFTWQGQIITVTFVVTNTGETEALAVELRDEFAPEFQVLASAADGAGVVEEETTRQGATILTAHWPELAPGAAVTLDATVQIADDVVDGAVIDNLAVVNAANATGVTAGLSIGMPPTTLPDFR